MGKDKDGGKEHLIWEIKEKVKRYEINHNNNNVPSVKEGHELIYLKHTQYKKVGIGQ